MGIFDALIGANTTKATDAATAAQIPYLWGATAGANNILTDQYGRARDDLTSNAGLARGALSSGYGAATDAVSGYGQQGQNLLAGRTDQAANTALGGNASLQPYADGGGGAFSMLLNAYGLNGQAGSDAARSAFTASPGYQYQVDQATDAAARKAASLGLAGSGNTLDAITRLGSNLANQEWGNWTSGLSGASNQGLTAANAAGANTRAAATLQGTAGTTGAALSNNTGQQLGTIDAAGANQMANNYGTLGQLLGSNDTSLGSSLSTNVMNTQHLASGLAMSDASAQDRAASTNNGIFSKLLMGTPGGAGSGLLGSLASALKL